MRTVSRHWLGVGLLIVIAAPAAAQDPKDIIDRSIRAQAGGEGQLAKRKVSISRSRGIMVLPGIPGGGDVETVREVRCVLPERIKYSGEMQLTGNKVPFVITLDGFKGWRKLFGAAEDMTQPEFDAVQDEVHFLWLSTLIPLKERSYTLSALPEIKVNDRQAVGVKIESRGRDPVQLYFDTRDNLLVKGVYRSREAGLAVTKESFFSDYKDFGGLKLPGKQTTLVNGKKTEDWKYESYSFPDRIDAKEFAKP
jgi:hypothetical protein